MYRPNGTTVVTAVLGALGVFGVIWSKGAEPTLFSERPVPSAQSATLDFPASIQAHTGAWRARLPRAPEAEGPAAPAGAVAAKTDAMAAPSPSARALPAIPGVDARPRPKDPGAAASPLAAPGTLAGAEAGAIGPAAMQPEDTPREAEAVAEDVTVKPSFAPSAAGRMGLAGPDTVRRSGAAHGSHVGAAVDPAAARARAHDRTPETAIPPATLKPKFGPEIFRDLDGVSF